MTVKQLAERFTNFAVDECKGSSELYEKLSLNISSDEQILELASHARAGQPVPNLLFGAVHYLLLKGKNHPLKDYYPSIASFPLKIEDSYVAFKDFCHIYRDEILSLLKTKIVQTNEVRRCAYLYPTFCTIFEMVKKPLALIEIGTSAGLQLLWDKYSYSYGTNEVFGAINNKLHITSEVKGDSFPFLLFNSPQVAVRVGIDLHINDLSDDEDYLWLKSLIWPNHHDRLEMFEKAAHCFKENSVCLIEGDGVALLSDISKNIPEEATICVFHTHVANQIPEESKQKLLERIRTIGSKRDIFHLYNNMTDRLLHLDYFLNGKEYTNTIGETDGHGKWFYWGI